MIAINAHFDGRVIVPDEPVELPVGALRIRIDPVPNAAPTGPSALDWIVQNAAAEGVLPNDLSVQHDHYLYGTPKRPQ